MKELIDMMRQDFREEGFTRRDCVVAAIVAPVVVMGLCLLPEAVAELLMRLAGIG